MVKTFDATRKLSKGNVNITQDYCKKSLKVGKNQEKFAKQCARMHDSSDIFKTLLYEDTMYMYTQDYM